VRCLVVKSGNKGRHRTQKNSSLKISQSCASSSKISSKVCDCEERLLLLKATTVKNKDKLFWRCKYWTVSEKFHPDMTICLSSVKKN